MNVRQFINDKPAIAIGILAALVAIAILVSVMIMHAGAPKIVVLPPGDNTKGFYSDDDGKTFFVDAVHKVTPFKHGAKTAVRAYVFKCGDATFIGYLGEDTPLGVQQADVYSGAEPAKFASIASHTPLFEVKKPGAGKWVELGAKNFAEWQPITTAMCPNGKDLPTYLLPGQQ